MTSPPENANRLLNNTIQHQKHQHGVDPNLFISINERMILHKRAAEPCCFLLYRGIKRLSVKCMEGNIECGIQKPWVPKPVNPSSL